MAAGVASHSAPMPPTGAAASSSSTVGPPPTEEVDAIVQNALSACIPPDVTYMPRRVNEWIDALADACLRDLAAQGRPYKYAVAITLTQRTGSGLATAAAAYWDPRRDASQVVVWENDHLQCLVTVHALCLDIVAEDGMGR
jgi:hypothetical protein